MYCARVGTFVAITLRLVPKKGLRSFRLLIRLPIILSVFTIIISIKQRHVCSIHPFTIIIVISSVAMVHVDTVTWVLLRQKNKKTENSNGYNSKD